jgi:hypothetical protein
VTDFDDEIKVRTAKAGGNATFPRHPLYLYEYALQLQHLYNPPDFFVLLQAVPKGKAKGQGGFSDGNRKWLKPKPAAAVATSSEEEDEEDSSLDGSEGEGDEDLVHNGGFLGSTFPFGAFLFFLFPV